MKRSILLGLVAILGWGASAQSNTFEGRYTRPIGDVLSDMERRFNVEIKVEVDTAGVVLPYADSRLRPYSVEESLDNVLKPLDFRWERKGSRKFVVRYFDYPRRTFPEGKKMIDYLSTLYSDKSSWEARRDSLIPEVRGRLGIDSLLAQRVASPRTFFSKVRKYDGYSVQNYALETLPGLFICGSIYTPLTKGKHPLIICPVGHFANGRYNDEQQIRKATLARMGAICVDYDLIGWGESALQLGEASHRTAMANTMQLLNGLCILDFMIDRKDVDRDRIGLNGGSGGGTQVLYLAMLDPRFAAACPTVNIGAHFDGGCPCESGMRATLAGGGSCHPEFAACFAPRPMMVVSDGGDWTAQVPEVEFPYLQRVYGFYDAADQVRNVHLPDERHDFGPNKRKAVYEFFSDVFDLDPSRIDESKVTVESISLMKIFGENGELLPPDAIRF